MEVTRELRDIVIHVCVICIYVIEVVHMYFACVHVYMYKI